MLPRLLLTLTLLLSTPALAQDPGLVTLRSTHPVRETLDRFAQSVRAQGMEVFTEIDHAAAARAAGLTLPPRIVLFFGNPAAGTPAMQDHPTLALDLPMRILVWQDAAGAVFITRSTGADLAQRLYARHGIAFPADAQASTEAWLDALVRDAAQ